MLPKSAAIPESDAYEDVHEEMFTKTRGCCFIFPCMASMQPSGFTGGGSVFWQRIKTVEKCEADDRWWIRGWNKLREWSELLAGPKWKTFIRRLSRNPNCCWGGGVTRHDHGKFQYDPLSYSLNFDDGKDQLNGRHVDEGLVYRDFSSRYVPLPVSTKSSMDLTGSEQEARLYG